MNSVVLCVTGIRTSQLVVVPAKVFASELRSQPAAVAATRSSIGFKHGSMWRVSVT